MPGFTDILDFLRRSTFGANKAREQKSIEAQKAENEKQKLTIDEFKALTEAKQNEGKSAAEILGIEADTRGKELDNVEKKRQALRELSKDLPHISIGPPRWIEPTKKHKTEQKALPGQQAPGVATPSPAGPQKPALPGQAGPVTPPLPGSPPGEMPPPTAPEAEAMPPEAEAMPPEAMPEGAEAEGEVKEARRGPSPDEPGVITLTGRGRGDWPELPEVPKPGPDYLADALKALDDATAGEAMAKKARDDLMDFQQVVTENLVKARNEYADRITENLNLQQEMAEQAPTYRSAISNVNWISKIVSLMDAGLLGHIRESPTYMLDQFVQKELQDQMMIYKEKKGVLAEQRNAYERFFEIDKDLYNAEMATLGFLYKVAGDNVKSLSNIATNYQTKLQLVQTVEELEHNRSMAEKKLEMNIQKNLEDRTRKNIELEFKARKDKREQQREVREQAKLGISLEKLDLQREKQEGVMKARSINLAPGADFSDIYDKDTLKETRQTLKTSRRSVMDLRVLEADVEKMKGTTMWKGLFAGLPVKFGDKELALAEDINKSLINAMLTRRIDFTGGGNMSQQEQKWLREFYNVEGGKYVLKDAQKISKILLNKWKGKYQQLFDLLKKDAFFNAYLDMENSPSFASLGESDKFKLISNKLGLKPPEMKKILGKFTKAKGL